jgi:hypothetical protein
MIVALILFASDYVYGNYIYRSINNFYFSLVWFVGMLFIVIAMFVDADERAAAKKTVEKLKLNDVKT